jgi:hypothetical protein
MRSLEVHLILTWHLVHHVRLLAGHHLMLSLPDRWELILLLVWYFKPSIILLRLHPWYDLGIIRDLRDPWHLAVILVGLSLCHLAYKWKLVILLKDGPDLLLALSLQPLLLRLIGSLLLLSHLSVLVSHLEHHLLDTLGLSVVLILDLLL